MSSGNASSGFDLYGQPDLYEPRLLGDVYDSEELLNTMLFGNLPLETGASTTISSDSKAGGSDITTEKPNAPSVAQPQIEVTNTTIIPEETRIPSNAGSMDVDSMPMSYEKTSTWARKYSMRSLTIADMTRLPFADEIGARGPTPYPSPLCPGLSTRQVWLGTIYSMTDEYQSTLPTQRPSQLDIPTTISQAADRLLQSLRALPKSHVPGHSRCSNTPSQPQPAQAMRKHSHRSLSRSAVPRSTGAKLVQGSSAPGPSSKHRKPVPRIHLDRANPKKSNKKKVQRAGILANANAQQGGSHAPLVASGLKESWVNPNPR